MPSTHPVATSSLTVSLAPFIPLTACYQAGWWPLLSGWQGEIETSVSSDFTVHVKPSLIAWLTELAKGLASDRVARGWEHLLWFLDRNLEASDSDPAEE